MNDLSVIDAVMSELARLDLVDGIEVHDRNGVVTITGKVADRDLRRILSQELLRLPQVLGLCNELEIAPPKDEARQAFAES